MFKLSKDRIIRFKWRFRNRFGDGVSGLRNLLLWFFWLVPEAFIALALILVIAMVLNVDPLVGLKENSRSSIVDLFIFGIVIVIFNKMLERRRDIRRWHEEIDDYRDWKEPEATNRIRGIIRRLNRQHITKIDLSNCFLADCNLSEANLQDSSLYFTSLERADLKEINLSGAELFSAKLAGANCERANFRGANLEDAHLEGARLEDADFGYARLQDTHLEDVNAQNADFSHANLCLSEIQRAKFNWARLIDTYFAHSNLQGADFGYANVSGADFRESDLRNVQNLTIEQISKTKTLYNAQMDPGILEQVIKKFPKLLENPDPEEAEEDTAIGGRP